MKKILFATIVAVACAAAAGAQDDEGRPKIFLEKKIFSDTTAGKKSFYEVHTVREGETLSKILEIGRENGVPPEDVNRLVREVLRANPQLKSADRLRPGQQIYVPSAALSPGRAAVAAGRAEAYKVVWGDRLIRIFSARGLAAREIPRYLDAVKELNPSIRNVDRIFAGRTIELPTAAYFEPAPQAPEVAAAPPGAAPVEGAAAEGIPEARPEAQLAREAPPPAAPATESGRARAKTEEARATRAKPPYRGLLMDVVAGLGEKWQDKGTLYLPVPSGGEVVLKLGEFPVVRFSGGAHALIDFRGDLTPSIRSLIAGTWKNYRIVSMEGAANAAETIDRLLRASGYHSVTEGVRKPLVIGESVAVTVPARWVVLPTEKSLLSGRVILVKEVAEKPAPELLAVLRYAERVGIRMIPFSVDEAANEGFVVGFEGEGAGEDPPALMVPAGGLPAVEFAVDFLGLPARRNERIQIGKEGKGSYALSLEPEIVFEAGGARHLVETGKMSPALLSLVKEAGYSVFRIGRDETGIALVQRVFALAGVTVDERRGANLSGSDRDGYEIRATGLFLGSKELLEKRKVRAVVLSRGKSHAATRALLRDIGVEIVGW